MPRAVVYADAEAGGIGLPEYPTEVQLQKILYVIHQVRANSTVGKYIEMAIQWYHTHCGTGHPTVSYTHLTLPTILLV